MSPELCKEKIIQSMNLVLKPHHFWDNNNIISKKKKPKYNLDYVLDEKCSWITKVGDIHGSQIQLR